MNEQNIKIESIYEQWGFSSSPFQTTSLPPSDVGAKLLTGRHKELQTLIKRIIGAPKFATVEGLNGVGKTSIVNVAAHHLFQNHLKTGTGPLFIPCRKIFQLCPKQNLESFVDDVLFEVAQTLIEKISETNTYGPSIETKSVNSWLNSPQLKAFQGGLQFATFGFSAGQQSETNTSKGFERSGFRRLIMDWLSCIFPTPEAGGVICIIDNLELLQSSEDAKEMIEQLRDNLLTAKGLRWVLCGSLGIVYGVVASPRMEGYLHKPLVIGEMDVEHAPEILKNRISVYSDERKEHILPLLADDFAVLYEILHGILRSVLSAADDFCNWVDEEGDHPTDDAQRHALFTQWLDEQSSESYIAVQQQLRATALRVFNHAVHVNGVFSPSDFLDFGFNGIPQFRPSIKDLENAGLLVSTRDEGDKRRKTIQITAKGWLINYHLKSKKTSVSEPMAEDLPSDVVYEDLEPPLRETNRPI